MTLCTAFSFRYPMVDAGMRCLWSCGWMHQSVRMVVASFLVEYESRLKMRNHLGHELNGSDRYLGISWVEGLRWFHDTLVDADVAINAMMWQASSRSYKLLCHVGIFLYFCNVLY